MLYPSIDALRGALRTGLVEAPGAGAPPLGAEPFDADGGARVEPVKGRSMSTAAPGPVVTPSSPVPSSGAARPNSLGIDRSSLSAPLSMSCASSPPGAQATPSMLASPTTLEFQRLRSALA